MSGSLPPALRARPLRGGDSAAGRSGAARWAPSPSPSRVSGSLGRGRAGPLWDAFQAQREDLGYSLFLLQAKRGAQPGKGAGLPGGLVPGSAPEVPRALKPALASVPRGHGSPVGLGTLYPRPDSSHRPRAAWRGRRRAASLSHGDSRVGLLASHLGAPHVALGGGKGGWAETAAGRSPAELEASGSDNSNNGAVAVRLASQSPRGRPSVPKSRN